MHVPLVVEVAHRGLAGIVPVLLRASLVTRVALSFGDSRGRVVLGDRQGLFLLILRGQGLGIMQIEHELAPGPVRDG